VGSFWRVQRGQVRRVCGLVLVLGDGGLVVWEGGFGGLGGVWGGFLVDWGGGFEGVRGVRGGFSGGGKLGSSDRGRLALFFLVVGGLLFSVYRGMSYSRILGSSGGIAVTG